MSYVVIRKRNHEYISVLWDKGGEECIISSVTYRWATRVLGDDGLIFNCRVETWGGFCYPRTSWQLQVATHTYIGLYNYTKGVDIINSCHDVIYKCNDIIKICKWGDVIKLCDDVIGKGDDIINTCVKMKEVWYLLPEVKTCNKNCHQRFEKRTMSDETCGWQDGTHFVIMKASNHLLFV